MTALEIGGEALPQERKLVTEIPGPKSREIEARRQSAVAPGVGSSLPAYVVAAGGGILKDVDGNQIIDLGAGIAVTTAGNSNPRVVKGATAQLESFTHTCFMVSPYEGYVEVAEALNRLTPGDHEKRSILLNSGAEAVENAVKIARAHTGRDAVVVFDHAYHGRTNLTMSMTSKAAPYKAGFGPFAGEVYRAPMSYPFRDNDAAGTKVSGEDAAKRVITMIEKQIGAEHVAAIVIEPIQGEGGFIVPAEGFLPALTQFAKDKGIVFVADEVQAGFARTGKMFASEWEGIVPDLITTAKGIAGGLPLSAVTGRAEIMDSVGPGRLGGTYGGNPVACAAALGAIASYEEDGLVDNASHIGEIVTGRLEKLQAKYPEVGDVRGRGAMIAAEFVQRDSIDPNPDLVKKVADYCAKNGVLVLTTGTYGNILRFLPPLTISDGLLNEAFDVIEEAVAASVG
ncbi:MAG: 4-aminobutyrate--2-oxoglutarate transaminase [Brevibacterium sp.]|uniref:4-aminobutyrate--2-oxoglutarate transaminase n=1 Tax=Brevibacterium sp. TaxID=1701 RepID=UPI002648AEB9|nr:4-aminobutyrate--2-oxoglutarate transaminase [Brevibacterium sp.]MDN5806631.1 4-aminobutyrate--2-oxoglutarate transaminase [Brevibacterium sp.]MDN5833633.1 4-aminobutyrate--2-oxoglutarate transaminase [Brevibacterium sp.]MDN5875250.1 4-aminobutyrate--2-oxoglutarate transaminase [Brevibacterium sp.]MDN6175576.1 4-aminobutyrate--2-oxoglutarate transaminase [Brevibacterium sp.]MDN6188834.1 4-aminobutyrate--2-oxoglutarate transaminase [Brevibacterium sp.]